MNASIDMLKTIEPKTDQLNADSLVGGPRTITITGVSGHDSAEQPVSIHYEGEDGRPFKPCKSMRRVMVAVWGSDASKYIGRSMTLYCDPEVQFGGMKVGGIRISHMSHIDKAQTMALTATRSKRKPFTVEPLVTEPNAADLLALFKSAYEAVKTQAEWNAVEADRAKVWKRIPTDDKPKVKAASEEAQKRIEW